MVGRSYKKAVNRMPYCLYVRKSRADAEAEARGEGETLSRHINTLLEYAKKRKLDVTQIHREIVSGETIAARPVMQQLLTEVEQGLWDGVLVMEVERLARGDTIDQGIVAQTFKYSDTKIITPLKDYNPNDEYDEEYFEFGLFMSRREYKTINRRLQRGRLTSVKEGKWVGNKAPYGYERVKIPNDKGWTLRPLQPEADIVKLIFQLYTVGELQPDGSYDHIGIARIVRKLNNMGVKPRVADHWSPASIRDMMRNPVYAGNVRWNSRPTKKGMVDGKIEYVRKRLPNSECTVVKGLHPALVSEETFAIAQDYLDKNRKRPVNERGRITNPLAGIVVCAICGHRMVRRPYGGKNTPATIMCRDTACDNISSYCYAVERRILDGLKEWIEGYKANYTRAESEAPPEITLDVMEQSLEHLEDEHEKLNKQLDATHDLLEQGVYTTDQFLERSRKVSLRLKENENARRKLANEIDEERKRKESREQIVPKVEHLLEVYDSLKTAGDKNEMLKEVLDKVVYLKTVNGRWHNSPDDFEITIYPRIPIQK